MLKFALYNVLLCGIEGHTNAQLSGIGRGQVTRISDFFFFLSAPEWTVE